MRNKIYKDLFYEKVSSLKKAISLVTASVFIWVQLGWVQSAHSTQPTRSGSEGVIIYQYNKDGFVTQGADLKQGRLTNYVGGKIDYTYYIGTDGGKVILTEYTYTEKGSILKITDHTSGKYIQYGDVKDSNGSTIGWNAIEEYSNDGICIGEYVYDDFGVLIQKDIYDVVNKAVRERTKEEIDKERQETAKKRRGFAYLFGLKRLEIKGFEDVITEEQRTKIGSIIYANGKPSEMITYFELRDHDMDDKTADVWISHGEEGRVSKTWQYDNKGKLVSSTDYKWEKVEVWYKQYEKNEYVEITIYDDSERPYEIIRDGTQIGTYTYRDGKLVESAYNDISGLLTVTTYDKNERPVYALTTGIKNQFIDAMGVVVVPTKVRTETTWTYNDTSKPIDIVSDGYAVDDDGNPLKDDTGKEIKGTVLPGGVISRHSVTDVLGYFSVSRKKSAGLGKVKINIQGKIDVTTDTTEYFDRGQKIGTHTVTDNRSETHVSVSKGSSIIGAIFVGILVFALSIIVPGLVAVLNTAMTTGFGTLGAGATAMAELGAGATFAMVDTVVTATASQITAASVFSSAAFSSWSIGIAAISGALSGLEFYNEVSGIDRSVYGENESRVATNPANNEFDQISILPPVAPPVNPAVTYYAPQPIW